MSQLLLSGMQQTKLTLSWESWVRTSRWFVLQETGTGTACTSRGMARIYVTSRDRPIWTEISSHTGLYLPVMNSMWSLCFGQMAMVNCQQESCHVHAFPLTRLPSPLHLCSFCGNTKYKKVYATWRDFFFSSSEYCIGEHFFSRRQSCRHRMDNNCSVFFCIPKYHFHRHMPWNKSAGNHASSQLNYMHNK